MLADDSSIKRCIQPYGERRQKSVFECHISDAQFKQLWERLEAAIDSKEESVLCYELCRACVSKVKALGMSAPTLPEAPYYLV